MNDQIFSELHSVSQRVGRLTYQSPRLSSLGDVCSMTEAGSMNGTEGFTSMGMCNVVNFPPFSLPSNNMC